MENKKYVLVFYNITMLVSLFFLNTAQSAKMSKSHIDHAVHKLTTHFFDKTNKKISWKCYTEIMIYLINDYPHSRAPELKQWLRDVGSSESMTYIAIKFAALKAKGTEGMPEKTKNLFDSKSLAELNNILSMRIELNKKIGKCDPEKNLKNWGMLITGL